MPYTPPSHRSPASSAPTSPDLSRRSSFHATTERPSLPKSSSYLAKHRRAPSASSISNASIISQPTPSATSSDLKGMAVAASIRASPPPVTDGRAMPKGAIISPPESQSSSDDDELPEMRGRKIENLQELHDAISQIPQHRSSSPSKSMPDAGDLMVLPSQATTITDTLTHSFSATSLGDVGSLSRMISHSRSITEPNVKLSKSADTSLSGSEEESEGDLLKKPQMVRKKSGELVRPALRPPSRRRPSSMPGTPTFKAVHFDSHLEHVRHFLQVDRPLAVSAGTSPADNYDSDTEYPFGKEEKRTPPYEWEIIMSNFPLETPARKAQAVRLERVWLSTDQKCLTGSVAVANLAFQKTITCRFTLDYWKTTSEIVADYVAEIRPKETPQGHDRFQFTIKLSDLANLETKTLYFCIRYSVNGQELWDNNDGTNFQIDFKKKMLPQNGKNGLQGAASRTATGLPRSNRRGNQGSGLRPKSVGFDDFGGNSKVDFDQSIQDYLGESGPQLRLKGVKSATNLPSDNLTRSLASPSGQAFANRYDFGASLTAAVQAAKDAMSPDGLYMKPNRRGTSAVKAPSNPPIINPPTIKTTAPSPAPTTNNTATSANKSLPPVTTSIPSGPPPPGPSGISSASYEELVNKYCFFGSKQSSPQLKDGTLQGGQLDGTIDNLVTNSTNSSNPSLAGTPLHLSNLRTDVNPFFRNAFAASPVTSTLQPTSNQSSSQPRSSANSARAVSPAVSPGSMGSAFSPFAGTSPNEFSYHMQDRFPFTCPEAHAATAIKG